MAASFEFIPGPRLVVGPGTLARLGDLAREFGCRRALVTSDPGIVAAGHTAAGVATLHAAGLATAVFSAFGENPSTAEVETGTALAREFRPDLLVGLGGGSSMDCAKGINFLVSRGGRMEDYKGRGRGGSPLLASIAVPTTAGTGSETQSFALITDSVTGMKMACGDPAAAFRVAILDVNLTLTQPPRVAAMTGVDAVAHAVESFVSTASTPASRMLAREAWRLLATNLPVVLAGDRDPQARVAADSEARAAVQLGAAWAGLAIENSMLGAAHALANPLTAAYGTVHGQAVGLALPHVVRFNAPAAEHAYGELLHAGGIICRDGEAAATLAAWLDDLLAAAGLGRSLREVGIDAPDIPALAHVAATQWTGGFNPRPVTLADLAAIYEAVR
ncbi:MAG: iron-containing alcohol dehydrogenase [Planctomycetota bacterium]